MYKVTVHFRSSDESLIFIVRADNSREAIIKAIEVVRKDVEIYRVDVNEEPAMVVVS